MKYGVSSCRWVKSARGSVAEHLRYWIQEEGTTRSGVLVSKAAELVKSAGEAIAGCREMLSPHTKGDQAPRICKNLIPKRTVLCAL